MRSGQLRLPLLLALASCAPRSGNVPSAPPPLRVTTVTVVPRTVPVTFSYPGRTEGSKEVEIRPRVSGILESRDYVEGELVAAGQVLFQIDPNPLLAQQTVAKAELVTAQARWTQADRESARLAPLVADKAVSRREADDAVSVERITAAAVEAAKARLAEVQLNLSYTRVTSPITGVAGRALRSEGNLVAAGTDALTAVLQLDPLYAVFRRSESEQLAFDRDVANGALVFAGGAGFEVEILASDDTVLLERGTLDFTDAYVDRSTGTVLARATLPNPDSRVRAGQPCQVVLRGAARKDVLAVPQRAIVEGATGKSVWVVKPDHPPTAELRAVEVGEWVATGEEGAHGHAWVVRSGLRPGDRVIVDRLVQLGMMPPGAPLDPVEEKAPSSRSSAPSTGR